MLEHQISEFCKGYESFRRELIKEMYPRTQGSFIQLINNEKSDITELLLYTLELALGPVKKRNVMISL